MLQSLADNGFYVGITNDVNERLKKHNKGEVKSTKNRRPLKIVYLKNHCSYEDARKHEKWLKKKDIKYKVEVAQLARLK